MELVAVSVPVARRVVEAWSRVIAAGVIPRRCVVRGRRGGRAGRRVQIDGRSLVDGRLALARVAAVTGVAAAVAGPVGQAELARIDAREAEVAPAVPGHAEAQAPVAVGRRLLARCRAQDHGEQTGRDEFFHGDLLLWRGAAAAPLVAERSPAAGARKHC